MAAASNAKSMKCPSCGVVNSPVSPTRRCGSCGAGMDSIRPVRSPEMERQRRYQQEGFNVVWCLIALVVQAVLTAAIVVGLPMVVPALDFEGSNGMLVAVPVWFVGGMLLGMISPGKTFIEPVVAAFLVAIPTVLYLANGQTVRTMPHFMFVIMALIGVMFTLIGSYIGERIQMGPPPKPAD
jgi:hypothetical protein